MGEASIGAFNPHTLLHRVHDVSVFRLVSPACLLGSGEVVDLGYHLIVGALHLAVDAECEDEATHAANHAAHQSATDKCLLELARGFRE